MNYTLHQLKIFTKVAEYQSITRASEELHLTQPAVSIQLKKLQEQMDMPLTEVVGRQLYITDFGKKVALASKKILEETDSIRQMIQQHKGMLTGKIRISSVSTGKYVIPYFLKSFIEKYPGVDVSINVSNKTAVLKEMSENKSDFYLVSVLPEDVKVAAIPLLENRLHLVGCANHQQRFRSVGDLSKVTLLFREKGSATRNAMEAFLRQHDIVPKNTMELVSNEAVKQAVNAGLGYSIMPLIGLQNVLQAKSMEIIPMKGLPIITQWNLVYNKGRNLNPAQDAFLHYIEEHKNRLAAAHFGWCEHHH